MCSSDTSQHDPQVAVQARRGQILKAAAAVFSEKGYHRATSKDIAAAAGISEGTIYNYFRSKSDLLVAIIARLSELESLDVEMAQALVGADARCSLLALLRRRVSLTERNEQLIRAIVPEIISDAALRGRFVEQLLDGTTAPLERYLEAQIASGQMRQVDIPLCVRALQSLMLGLVLMRLMGDPVVTGRWQELPELLVSLIFDGLAPAQDRQSGLGPAGEGEA